MYKLLINGNKVTIYENAESRLEAMKAVEVRGVPFMELDAEIEVVDKLFSRERMVGLIAAAKTFERTGERKRAAHYLLCAREESKRWERKE